MDSKFIEWLEKHFDNKNTRQTAISDVRRIWNTYGDLDEHYDRDGLESVLSDFSYSAIDERNNESNPTKMDFTGKLRTSISAYKSHLNRYVRFKEDAVFHSGYEEIENIRELQTVSELSFRYEQDLQTALIACIDQLETGMSLIQNGKEYSVPSGRIDALCLDAQGGHVVIELKAVTAKRDVLGQIAAYMADIEEETGKRPRGILIAPDFDDKLVSGARMISGLKLMRYSFKFSFFEK